MLNSLDHLLLLRVSIAADGNPEMIQLPIDVENWACEIYMPELKDDSLTYYVFGQTDLKTIKMRSFSVDAAFTKVEPISEIEDVTAHLDQVFWQQCDLCKAQLA